MLLVLRLLFSLPVSFFLSHEVLGDNIHHSSILQQVNGIRNVALGFVILF
jgi:hypothetical protein